MHVLRWQRLSKVSQCSEVQGVALSSDLSPRGFVRCSKQFPMQGMEDGSGYPPLLIIGASGCRLIV